MKIMIVNLFFLFSFADVIQGVRYSITCNDVVVSMMADVKAKNIEDTIRRMSSFETRFYTGKEALVSQELIAKQWGEFAKGRDDVRIELYHHNWPEHLKQNSQESSMPSVILTIEGSESPQDIIIVGAHGDSIAVGPKYSGKNLVLYNVDDDKNVIGVLNFDMTNFRGSDDLVIVNDLETTSREQDTFLARLIDTYLPEISWESPLELRRSDHISWSKRGFKASMLTDSRLKEQSKVIHSAEDTFKASGENADHSINFVKVGLAFLVELGSVVK